MMTRSVTRDNTQFDQCELHTLWPSHRLSVVMPSTRTQWQNIASVQAR